MENKYPKTPSREMTREQREMSVARRSMAVRESNQREEKMALYDCGDPECIPCRLKFKEDEDIASAPEMAAEIARLRRVLKYIEKYAYNEEAVREEARAALEPGQ